ncbi:MAG: hypothetical protein ABIJ81_04445 [Patescibacteria group bacterium]
MKKHKIVVDHIDFSDRMKQATKALLKKMSQNEHLLLKKCVLLHKCFCVLPGSG